MKLKIMTLSFHQKTPKIRYKCRATKDYDLVIQLKHKKGTNSISTKKMTLQLLYNAKNKLRWHDIKDYDTYNFIKTH